MNILDILKQLRDDIKTWVTNNLNALNTKIDEKTIPIDDELSTTSTNPVQNKTITKAIKNIPTFSGDYNDLTNAPDISEDGSGTMVIADESGNIIFKADADGIHTTAVSLNGEAAASEKYVEDAIANIDIPEVDFTGYATEDFVTTVVDSAKEELSESTESNSDDWKVVDEEGNIIFSVDASGAHTTELTLNGESAATESYVDDAIANIEFPTTDLTDYATKEYVDNAVDGIEIPEVNFDGYATETYVDSKVADLVNSAPEALNTLGELATALETHEDAYDALLETVGSKATPEDLENLKTELSESIVSETDEFHIVDEAGNIVTSIDENGVATTTVTAQSIVVNGNNVEEHIDDTNIHVTAAEKEAWNSKSNFSGSYNDLTDKPAPTDLTGYATETFVAEKIVEAKLEGEEVDLSGYATEDYVDTAIQNAQLADKDIDLTNYYTKQETEALIPDTSSFLKEVPDEYVTESELTAKGYLTEHQSLAGLATTLEVETHAKDSAAHVTSEEKQQWNAKSNFSGDYNDLTNAPDITENASGDLVIADSEGNILFRASESGLETTHLTLGSLTINGMTIQELVNACVEEALKNQNN